MLQIQKSYFKRIIAESGEGLFPSKVQLKRHIGLKLDKRCRCSHRLLVSLQPRGIAMTRPSVKRVNSDKTKETSRSLKTGKVVIQHLSEIMLYLNYCIFSVSAAAALVRSWETIASILIA